MAKDSILRLRVESSEYDAKLKKAAEGIQHLADVAHKSGGELTGLEKSELDFIRELGSMETVSKSAAGQLKELESAYKDLASTYNSLNEVEKADEGGKALAASLEELKQRAQEARANFDAASKSLEMPKAESVKSQLRDLTQELTNLTVAYRSLSDEEKSSQIGEEMASKIQKLTDEAANMKDAMGDVQASIKNAASDTQKFDQVAGVLQSVTSGFQTAQGAARLMGIQVGDDVKILADLQAAMAVTSGFQTMQNLLQKQSALMQGVNALQKEFNILAKANPYVLLATAAAAVVAAYVAWTSGARDAEKAQKALNGEIEATKNQLAQIDKDTDFSVGIAEAAGKSWQAIHELRLEAARTKLQLADMNYDKLAASGNASAEQMKQAAEMQKQAWDGVMKVLNEGTIHEIQKRNGTGPFASKGGKASSEDTNFADDSIMAQQKKVEELTDAWKRAAGAVRDDYKKQLDQAQTTLDMMMGKSIDGGQLAEVVVTPRIAPIGDTTMGEDMVNDLTTSLVNAADNMDLTAFTQKFQEALANGASDMDMTEYFENLKETLSEYISEEEWPQIELAIKTGDLTAIEKFNKQIQNAAKNTEQGWKMAANAVTQLGGALSQIEDPGAKAAGTVMKAISSIALGFAEASTQANTAGTGWGWLAWLAAGAAAMATTISTIHSLTGFANGGIVPGNSYSGDNMRGMTPDGQVFGLNAQEVVLNRAQVGNLASQLEGNGLAGMQLETRVNAEEIIFVLNNNANRRGYKPFIND